MVVTFTSIVIVIDRIKSISMAASDRHTKTIKLLGLNKVVVSQSKHQTYVCIV